MDTTGQNGGCFCLVLLVFVFTLNHFVCLAFLTALMPNFLHNFFLLTSNVSRSSCWHADLYESFASPRMICSADFCTLSMLILSATVRLECQTGTANSDFDQFVAISSPTGDGNICYSHIVVGSRYCLHQLVLTIQQLSIY